MIKKILVSSLALALMACGLLWVERGSEKRFVNSKDFYRYVEGPYGAGSSAWKGTFYCGDRGGESYFRHYFSLSRVRWIVVKSECFEYDDRIDFTGDRDKWTRWSEFVKRWRVSEGGNWLD